METTDWQVDTRAPEHLGSEQVFLSLLNFDDFENIHPYWEILNSSEQKRANKFYFEIDKKRFVITRALLKRYLGDYNRLEPKNIDFTLNAYGKPLMDNQPFYFNVAHSEKRGLIGITQIAEIGVDVEHFRQNTDLDAIAKRFFSTLEYDAFCALPQHEHKQGFFNAWTRKEAFIKAVGMGLSMPLHAFDVSLSPREEARLSAVRFDDEKADDWQIMALPIMAGYAAAFCLKSTKRFDLILRNIQPEM